MEKRQKENFQRETSEKAVMGIAGTIIRLQRAWSAQLGRFAGRYTARKQKTFFICFFVLALMGNAWLTLSALRKGKAVDPAPEIAEISLPVIHKSGPVRDSAGLYRAEKFLLWFDGLEKTAEGKRQRDSIAARRPGLVDSIRTWVKRAR